MKEEALVEVKEKLALLSELYEQRAIIHEDIAEVAAEEEAEIKKLQELIDELTLHARRRTKQQHDDLMAIDRSIEQAQAAVKASVYALPDEDLKGFKIDHAGIRVKVSKVTASVQYKEELLTVAPALEKIAGAVTRVINPAIVQRLIDDGVIAEEKVAPYRTTVRVKNPSVSIELKEEEDGPE